MKNQYFGDVYDYRKYGLLRCFAHAGFRPMLCWMLTADDHGTDGQKRTYLDRPDTWRHHDPELFDALGRLLDGSERPTVHDLCTEGLIAGATDHAELLEDREDLRKSYFDALHDRLEGDLAFFDPDNGLEVRSVRRGNKSSSKYVYWAELERVYDAGLSLLVYQHLPRRSRAEVALELVSEASRRLVDCEVHCLSAGAVLFLLAVHPEHHSRASHALEKIERCWAPAIRAIDPSDQAPEATIAPRASGDAPLGMRPSSPMTGNEPFHAAGASLDTNLRDLWSWACSDLVSNAFRGTVAEYLVATALGVARGTRSEWDAFDLETPDGIRVEVKSSAYVQTWHQDAPSRPSFGIAPTRGWDAATNQSSSDVRRQADVHVFCLLAHRDQATIDPMDVTQWRFLVLATSVLDERLGTQARANLAAIERTGAVTVGFDGIARAVREAGKRRA